MAGNMPLVYSAAAHTGEIVQSHLEPKSCLDTLRLLCKGKADYDKRLCAGYSGASKNGRDMRHASALLEQAIDSIVRRSEQSVADSCFSDSMSSFLDVGIQGLDDFELICFLVVRPRSDETR
ncbi:MAG: hypothetical protein LKF49_10715 [Bifidobacterium tibiigranuli]|jgi:hypothetical protein|uniref:hypothetical protein n=1 Tax=Bifidobacterium tibiigranuli TaxID=2172043 RepID=UPI002352BBB3|nr:hypothetical protein [Bifidobacterium tibiigranuli]MCH3973601.1 hypothetical protein [Bifidobacterium tibiigranuli]MCH4189741.1 hypothetical protein [Bifidobacterium tibiigranuli]MCH4204654.1 hypothetical protein [Bifidobacterium tibiigranuli]MCH4275436.1 hypothetical protein [Bifidobacterium tibiigranuli]MCI1791895.1 hypothetical protein [Bifidobacterium tibiigranuli]